MSNTRKANITDVELLESLENSLRCHNNRFNEICVPEVSRGEILDNIVNGEIYNLLEFGQECVGFIHYIPERNEIEGIWIREIARGLGYGSLLVGSVLNENISVECNCKDLDAIEFYKSIGFQVINQTKMVKLRFIMNNNIK